MPGDPFVAPGVVTKQKALTREAKGKAAENTVEPGCTPQSKTLIGDRQTRAQQKKSSENYRIVQLAKRSMLPE